MHMHMHVHVNMHMHMQHTLRMHMQHALRVHMQHAHATCTCNMHCACTCNMHCLLAQDAAPLATASVDHAALGRVGLCHALTLAPDAGELLPKPAHAQEDGGGWLRLGVRRHAQQRAATLEAAHHGKQDGRGELGGDTWLGIGLGLGVGVGVGQRSTLNE